MKISARDAKKLGLELPGSPKGTGPTNGTGHKQNRLIRELCKAHGLSEPVEEYRFHPTRKWRFDFLWDGWLALEVQGGIWTEGRHVRGVTLLDEHEKLNQAVLLGYNVLFCTPEDLKSGAIFPTIKAVLNGDVEQS